MNQKSRVLKTLAVFALLIFIVGIIGCSNSKTDGVTDSAKKSDVSNVTNQTKKLKVALLTNGPLSDWGFNYAHNLSIQYAQNELGDKIDTQAIGDVPETGDAERIMRRLISEKTDVIIAASFGYQDTTVKLASEFPKVKFLQAWGFKPGKNIGTYSSKMYQAWYVEGVVAGLMTKSNKLGIVAAHPIPPMKWQINAYVLGARSMNSKVEAAVTFINHWFDPGLATEATEALISNGCDIVCGVLDNSVAVAQTAQKRGVYLIGHNADLKNFAPDVCLNGTQWLWGKLYTDALKQMINGTWNGTNGDLNGGFKEGYVGITDFSSIVPEKVKNKANDTVNKFITGELTVYKGPIKDNKGNIVVKAGEKLTHGQIMGMNWLVDGIK